MRRLFSNAWPITILFLVGAAVAVWADVYLSIVERTS